MKVWLWVVAVILVALVITYFTGPKVPEPKYDLARPQVPGKLEELAGWVSDREAGEPLRGNNGAHVRFYGNTVTRTEYAIVYLHGFGGSWYDAYPVNHQLADSLGANLYAARWGDHGLKPPHSLVGFSADAAWEEAKTALEIGKRLGDKVIILSTSTGGTLALKLAAEFTDDVYALVNFSPNVKDDMPGTWVLSTPWGAELAALIGFGDGIREVSHDEPAANQYFDTAFVSSALVNLQNLVATTMRVETFARVTCPVLTLYYHKDGFNEDERVEVDVYDEMHAALGTAAGRKKLLALPTPKSHFLGCGIMSMDTDAPLRETLGWLRALKM